MLMSKSYFLNAILLLSVVAVFFLSFHTVFVITPSFSRLIISDTEKNAAMIAKHFAAMITEDTAGLDLETLSKAHLKDVAMLQQHFKLIKMKMFNPAGRIIFSTDEAEIGQLNTKSYFQDRVAKGQSYTKVVRKNNRSLEGEEVLQDVVETYVPIMNKDRFLGAFEIYYDITETEESIETLLRRSYAIIFFVSFILLAGIILSTWKAKKNFKECLAAERKIRSQSEELGEINQELGVLSELSSVMSRSIEMSELLPTILQTVTSFDLLDLAPGGGIFIVAAERMYLAAHLNHSEEFVRLHDTMRVGDCLCGQAAATGEILYSDNCALDCRHTLRLADMAPHGHVCIPLKSQDVLEGVLYLYLLPDAIVSARKRKLFQAIGDQIGMMLGNARLFEETRSLSLRDPLTGLANRRLLEISLERNVIMARRYDMKLAAIMLDIDHFKKYNDSHGHQAGDELLAAIGRILLGVVRESDVAARYGGEEFVILLPETTNPPAREIAERIRRTVEAQTEVTVSLGVSYLQPGMSGETLIGMADAALYQAKESGRNQIVSVEQPGPV